MIRMSEGQELAARIVADMAAHEWNRMAKNVN
jgi:hypothetical protein